MKRPRWATAATTLSVLVGAAVATTTTIAPAGAAPAAAPSYRVIASHLNNPRHLGVGLDGSLYVAESGTGGDGPQCLTGSDGTYVCYGPTGSVTQIRRTGANHWTQTRVLTGLPSLAPPPSAGPQSAGSSAVGPADVQVLGGHYAVTIGLGAGCSDDPDSEGPAGPLGPDPSCDPRTANDLPGSFGSVLVGRLGASTPHILADVAHHEFATNPVDNPDSNPASLGFAGAGFVVADAGANTLVRVGLRGQVRTIASFPDVTVANPFGPAGSTMPMQFVPTDAVRGPDGAWYVSQLTGFPFPKGGSTIWRIRPGTAPEPFATGLTNVTSLAFGLDGSLYAVEISTAGLANPDAPPGPPLGALVRIPRHGGTPTVVADGLMSPYGVAILGTNAYVTTGSVLPGAGEVIEIPVGFHLDLPVMFRHG